MNAYAGAVLDQLDRLFNRGTIAGLSEGRLLERYVADGDEAAFAALVARHGPMVLGVCRRVLRDERDVEDAFQATFLVLVRRAGVIREGELVGRWLHGVARRVAVRTRAHSARRFAHEQSVNELAEPVVTDTATGAVERGELASVVDEELTRLPSTLRAPVVLCYLEGLSHDEAARRLRWPVGTVRSRMARAREILRHRLARRGVMADGMAIVASLARPPVPPEWLDATVRGSLDFATRSATAAATIASARSVAIARRVLQTMIVTKLSYIGAAGLGLVLALGGVRTLAFQGPGEAGPIGLAPAAAQTSGDRSDAPVPPTPAEPPSDRSRRLASSVLAIGDELDRALRELAELQARLRKLEAEVNPRPAPLRSTITPAAPARPPTPTTPLTAAGYTKQGADPRKADNTEIGKPTYYRLGTIMMIVSPDGSRMATYDLNTNRSHSLKVPPIQGSRREIHGTSFRSAFMAAGQRHTADRIRTASSPWFLVLDLDQPSNVTRIAALHVLDGTWIDQDVPAPVARSSVKVADSGVVTIGQRLYAFSEQAKRWGVLEFPPGVNPPSPAPNAPLWAEKEGRLYLFNATTGTWDDIYARSIENEKKPGTFDTRSAPAQ